MNLGVALLPQLLPADWAREPSVALVIDTLRFTSTACVALEAGAESIVVMSDIDSARKFAVNSLPHMLLCGERHCTKIPGFDLGNSPLEYSQESVRGRQLLFSTTNGTRAVEAAQTSQTIALASLLNRAAVAQWLSAQSVRNTWILCAGTDGQVAHEDVLTAGAIVHRLAATNTLHFSNDSAVLALNAWQNVERVGSLLHSLQAACGGKNLVEAGFARDVEFVSRLDRCDVVPLLLDGAGSPLLRFSSDKKLPDKK